MSAATFDLSAYDLPPEPARDALSEALVKVAHKAADQRASLPPAPRGYYWHESVSVLDGDGDPYGAAGVRLAVKWRLEAER